MATKTKKPFVDPLDPFERGLEAMRSVGKTTTKGLQTEADASAREMLAQMFGLKKSSGEASSENHAPAEAADQAPAANGHVEIFNAKHHGATSESKTHADKAPMHAEKAHPKAEAAIDYHREIVKNREKVSKAEHHEMKRNIEQIKHELAKLVEASTVLKLEFAEVAVEQTVNVGQYQLNFFEWMLAVIRSARQKVEDSNAWLGTTKGKGAKKDYWGMFKKHGTTFGLSGERSVATSVG